MFFISEAFAESSTNPTGFMSGAANSNLASFLPIILIFVIFYFLLLRPQQKKMRQQKEMINALKRGDRIVTSGGIIGVIQKTDIEPDVISLEIADGVTIKIIKSAVNDVLTRSLKDNPK